MHFFHYEPSIICDMRLDIIYKNIKINLMDHLPFIKEGNVHSFYEITMLFRISSILNNITIKCPINNKVFIKNCERVIDTDSTLQNKIIRIGNETNALFRLETLLVDENLTHIPNIYEILEICIKN